ncbi:MAG: hypothetical protein DWQ31_21615 [Planctomycetota bacterium]|nr:MAG: hypothetical protein DWQ31_21615 [Planctomycetota bacterium]REJ93700.1 MAG: hypothetical protein DWQ35_10150 [Planctomycetota bacterium]REK25748.1 MAG: hypothetical protein DWQ42_10885 [Planctomycetota bacterium]REK46505.1 MAG: hypothetical protein DWQ46_06420 [Planctomycetota bacterium]
MLGALETDEHNQLADRLQQDAGLRDDLKQLEKCLDPLRSDKGHIDPPAGLAHRCCEEVRRRRSLQPSPAARSAADFSARSTSGRRWSFADIAVAAGILIALGVVAIPTVEHAQFSARLAGCQNNLRALGQALQLYSQKHPDNLFPVIAEDGPNNRAGAYMTTLVSEGLVDDPTSFVCPSFASASSSGSKDAACSSPLVSLEKPSEPNELDALLEKCGSGAYAYTLGYRDGTGYHPTKNLGRTNFAIMADAPCPNREFAQTSCHDGLGQNVLFEDGHVGYEEDCRLSNCQDDDFYRNRRREIAPGVDIHDAVLGSPGTNPHAR